LGLALCLATPLAGGLAAAAEPAAAPQSRPAATTRSLVVEDFYLFADDDAATALTNFAWPEQRVVNAVIRVSIGGFEGEESVGVFLALSGPDEEVIAKHKGSQALPVGTHELVIPALCETLDFVGEEEYVVDIEVSLKGVLPHQAQLAFDGKGPDLPRIEIDDLELFAPGRGSGILSFEPGGSFSLDCTIEVSDNPAQLIPAVIAYAVVDEDMHETDPEEAYQQSDLNWDRLRLDSGRHGVPEGVFHLRLGGRLPRYFSEPFITDHDFRVYVIVDWGPAEPGKLSAAAVLEYVSGEIYDDSPGDESSSPDLVDRLIQIDRAYTWRLRREGEADVDPDDPFNVQ
jgi:hypothetical protein